MPSHPRKRSHARREAGSWFESPFILLSPYSPRVEEACRRLLKERGDDANRICGIDRRPLVLHPPIADLTSTKLPHSTSYEPLR